jgi:hypothetical protein
MAHNTLNILVKESTLASKSVTINSQKSLHEDFQDLLNFTPKTWQAISAN